MKVSQTRYGPILFFFLFLLTGIQIFSGPVLYGQGEDRPSESERAEQIKLELEQVRVTLELEDANLTRFIELIRAQVSFDIVLHPAVEEYLRPEQKRVTLDLHDKTVKQVMKTVIESRHLRAIFENGIVQIKPEAIANVTHLVIHDVRDLILPLRDFQGPEFRLRRPEHREFVAGPRRPIVNRNANLPPLLDREETLLSVLRDQTADSDSWERDDTVLRLYGGLLFVRQTPEHQDEIEQFLRELRSPR